MKKLLIIIFLFLLFFFSCGTTEKKTKEQIKKVDDLYFSAFNYYEIGNYEKALSIWNKVLLLESDHNNAKENKELMEYLINLKSSNFSTIIDNNILTNKKNKFPLLTDKEIKLLKISGLISQKVAKWKKQKKFGVFIDELIEHDDAYILKFFDLIDRNKLYFFGKKREICINMITGEFNNKTSEKELKDFCNKYNLIIKYKYNSRSKKTFRIHFIVSSDVSILKLIKIIRQSKYDYINNINCEIYYPYQDWQ